jgi:hypothetical protein
VNASRRPDIRFPAGRLTPARRLRGRDRHLKSTRITKLQFSGSLIGRCLTF